ncbi:hypothetical protein MUK42_37569 [Musa troglodytarum]|uniref:Uncharacterized protein n=1 Tax=Musa troglodytarum TaxID=320322 RepID=A0A9E7JCI0_9LILI|nr:hypothetical protein MUK42_37569 [Musa troglodytarum]
MILQPRQVQITPNIPCDIILHSFSSTQVYLPPSPSLSLVLSLVNSAVTSALWVASLELHLHLSIVPEVIG